MEGTTKMNHKTEKTLSQIEALPKMDWEQVRLNGGPPCFATNLPLDIPGTFCGRAERWKGHNESHKFVSLDDHLQSLAAEHRANAERLRLAMEFICEMQQGHYHVAADKVSQQIAAVGKERG